LKQLSRHLTFANAISCVALFVALSGAAYAAKTTLGKKAVKTRNLANGAVTTLKLRRGSVTNLKLRNGAITGTKIAPGTIGTTELAKGSIRSEQLGGGVVTAAKLKDGAVGIEKLANSAVTNAKLGTESVATGKLQNGAVTNAKLSPSFLAQLVKNVTYVGKASGAVSATSPQSVTAECPAGKQVVGGGARVIAGDATSFQVTESVPFAAAETKRTGWTAAAQTSEATKTFAVEAVAICAEF
jgi:trimeric autotransporter adhesin